MIGNNPSAQSDDAYEAITFLNSDGEEVRGVFGLREGPDTRAIFQVWEGPSIAACGDDLAAAFRIACEGIRRKGFTPVAPEIGVLHDLLASGDGEDETSGTLPRVQPLLWIAVVLILLAALWPAFARAEMPAVDRVVPFPNAHYAWRYDGPDFDSRSDSEKSAARLRALASEAGLLEPDLSPRITVLDNETGDAVASYDLGNATFCDDWDDNCEMDGIFSMVLPGTPEEPVLAAVAHVGVHGQKLWVFRPMVDVGKAVFETSAEYALIAKLVPGGLFVEMEQSDKNGNVTREHRMWLTGDDSTCAAPPPVTLPDPPALSEAAAAFENDLRKIARGRNLHSFVDRMTDDVLVSFGGDGGPDEFLAELGEHESGKEAEFWLTLDRLLAQGGWNDRSEPETLTWPWFFAAWPDDEDAWEIFISNPDVKLRAGPDERSPILATLPFSVLRWAAPDVATETVDWHGWNWLPVATKEHCLGYVRASDVTPLTGTRMIARRGNDGWTIEAFVAGD